MKSMIGLMIAALAIAFSLSLRAQQPSGDGPRYSNGTSLIRPTGYREWIFLSSGLGMTYQAPAAGEPARPPSFTNIFVNPSSYRSFMQAGKWPDGTILVLEVRRSDSEASINKGGRFQTDVAGLEAHVKDARFPDGWAFFDLSKEVAEPLAGERVARCVECHTKNAAVERTFVQFYPTLLEVARKKGTVKPGF